MRLLHTSDWHLGLSSGPVSRRPDHEHFLTWLLELLDAREIDVLVVAGDVFDVMHPPAEAQRLYYEFLRDIGQTGVRDVVIVGGNHDSASRLDAPASLLGAFNVHVVGGLTSARDTWSRCVVPLHERGKEEPSAVALAVPYVHEFKLGIRSSSTREAARKAFHHSFGALYQELTDLACERYPDLPIVATGHLTAAPDPGFRIDPEDFPQEIHQLSYVDPLPPFVFDERIRYVALGHIHRAFAVIEGRAWYCGSPIPMNITEAQSRRRVLEVEVPHTGDVTITPHLVPQVRELFRVEGSPELVEEELGIIASEAPLPPLVRVRVRLPNPDPDLPRRLHAVLDAHPPERRPILIEIRQLVDVDEHVEQEAPPNLEDLDEREVFDKLLSARQATDRDALLEAFDQLVSAPVDALHDLIAEVTRR